MSLKAIKILENWQYGKQDKNPTNMEIVQAIKQLEELQETVRVLQNENVSLNVKLMVFTKAKKE
jgi:hypothetical protein